MKYKIDNVSDMLTEVRTADSDEIATLFISDVHYDSPKCDRDMLFRHLDQVADADGLVFVFGDFFDVMAGQHDRRRSKQLLRPEYVSGNYLQDVVMKAAEDLKPYGEFFAVIADGNHETAILKNQEIDINKWLVWELSRSGSPVVHMGYQGFIKFFVTAKDGSNVRSSLVYFHHGKYGGVVSKGVQGVARFASVVPQADIIVSGHTHDRWMVEQPQFHLRQNGEVIIKSQTHLKTATYKEAFAHPGGWDVEKIVMPKSLGGWWVTLRRADAGLSIDTRRAN